MRSLWPNIVVVAVQMGPFHLPPLPIAPERGLRDGRVQVRSEILQDSKHGDALCVVSRRHVLATALAAMVP